MPTGKRPKPSTLAQGLDEIYRAATSGDPANPPKPKRGGRPNLNAWRADEHGRPYPGPSDRVHRREGSD